MACQTNLSYTPQPRVIERNEPREGYAHIHRSESHLKTTFLTSICLKHLDIELFFNKGTSNCQISVVKFEIKQDLFDLNEPRLFEAPTGPRLYSQNSSAFLLFQTLHAFSKHKLSSSHRINPKSISLCQSKKRSKAGLSIQPSSQVH